MAGDWLKMRLDLDEDPAVIGIMDRTGCDIDAVLGKLYRVWRWANRQSRDGHAPVTLAYIDRLTGVPGFGTALVEVGWLEVLGEALLRFPEWDRHNGKSAKERALATSRKQMQRSRSCHAPVTRNCGPEKRREEKSIRTPLPPKGGCEGDSIEIQNPPKPPASVLAVPLPEALRVPSFREHWLEYLQHRIDSGRPLTPAAAKRQLARLAGWGAERAVRAIVYTVGQGWIGIVEEKTLGKRPERPAETPEQRAERLARERQRRGADEPAPEIPPEQRQKLREELDSLRNAFGMPQEPRSNNEATAEAFRRLARPRTNGQTESESP